MTYNLLIRGGKSSPGAKNAPGWRIFHTGAGKSGAFPVKNRVFIFRHNGSKYYLTGNQFIKPGRDIDS
jgi:hypothetical protein